MRYLKSYTLKPWAIVSGKRWLQMKGKILSFILEFSKIMFSLKWNRIHKDFYGNLECVTWKKRYGIIQAFHSWLFHCECTVNINIPIYGRMLGGKGYCYWCNSKFFRRLEMSVQLTHLFNKFLSSLHVKASNNIFFSDTAIVEWNFIQMNSHTSSSINETPVQ